MNRFKFAEWDSIDAEMKRFSELNTTNPEKGRNIYMKGELLVEYAAKGELFKLRKYIEETPTSDLLIYFVYKALKISLISGHLMVSSYIIDSGYPLNHDGLPNILRECLSELDDYLCVAVIRMLSSKGLDINNPTQGNWYTALHYAVQRRLVQSVGLLIQLGADVNAVGDKDVMPLNLAQSLPDSAEKLQIVDILMTSGAKTTWRRNNAVSTMSFGEASTSNTQMAVSSSNNKSDLLPKKMVKFTGGGNFAGEIVNIQQSTNNSNINSNNNSTVFAAVTKQQNDMNVLAGGVANISLSLDSSPSGGNSEKGYFEACDDGGFMFSTGN